MDFLKKVQMIQMELKAPKNLYNSFGKYKYRNAEGICEAVKPLLDKYEMVLTLSDDIVVVGDRYYLKSTATLVNVEITSSVDRLSVTAFARESLDKKGMDDSQITGTASSYARKYALNGLFLLDDTKDADSDEYHKQTETEEEQEPDFKSEMITDKDKKILEAIVLKKGFTVEQIFPNGLDLNKEQYTQAVDRLSELKNKGE